MICPECGSPVKRLMYPVGIVFKGSGWYVNDSRKPEKNGGESEPAKSAAASEPAKTEATDSKPKGEPAPAAVAAK